VPGPLRQQCVVGDRRAERTGAPDPTERPDEANIPALPEVLVVGLGILNIDRAVAVIARVYVLEGVSIIVGIERTVLLGADPNRDLDGINPAVDVDVMELAVKGEVSDVELDRTSGPWAGAVSWHV
jgi:hypothetical protein